MAILGRPRGLLGFGHEFCTAAPVRSPYNTIALLHSCHGAALQAAGVKEEFGTTQYMHDFHAHGEYDCTSVC